MAIHCRAVKNGLRSTLPHCTAGVAEPVPCSSRCLFLTNCGCQLSGTSGLFFGLCPGLHPPLSSARPSPSGRPLSWVCLPGRSPRSRGSILFLRRSPFSLVLSFEFPPLAPTDFPSSAGPAAKSARPETLLAPQAGLCVGLLDWPLSLLPGFSCRPRSMLRGRTLAPPGLSLPALRGPCRCDNR